jgi:hypothetical protein
MKQPPAVRSFVLLTAVCLLLSLSAMADSQLYTNGPVSGNNPATGFRSVTGTDTGSDSFGLASASTITSISFGDWVTRGDTPLTVTWSISSAPNGGTIYASGTSSLSSTFFCSASSSCGHNSYDVYTSSFATNAALGAGSYWLTFTGATASNGGLSYWDVNGGVGCAGTGCPSDAYHNGNDLGTLGSNSFALYGPAPIPEPSTVLDLFGGTGGFCLLGLAVRRFRAKLPIRGV